MPDTTKLGEALGAVREHLATRDEWPADYAERGIQPDTWACIFVGSRDEAEHGILNLALSGVDVRATMDADGQRVHLAVQGGMAASPTAWIVSLRGAPYQPIACPADHIVGQHPQATR